jgi:hypothetical protein
LPDAGITEKFASRTKALDLRIDKRLKLWVEVLEVRGERLDECSNDLVKQLTLQAIAITNHIVGTQSLQWFFEDSCGAPQAGWRQQIQPIDSSVV